MPRIPTKNVISGLHSVESDKQYRKKSNSNNPPTAEGCLITFGSVIIVFTGAILGAKYGFGAYLAFTLFIIGLLVFSIYKHISRNRK